MYGLGADATSDRAVASIYAAKGRPSFNPLIVHVAEADAAAEVAVVEERARSLARRFWPGPLTLVLARRSNSPVSLLVSAGLDTVAVRVPAHPVAIELIAASGKPLAAPSANRSSEISPTRAEDVAASLGDRVPLILDGGPCRVGIESTVLDLTGPTPVLLRPGGVTVEEIEAMVGKVAAPDPHGSGMALRSPGMLERHYAPDRPVRLDATEARAGEALLAFGPEPLGATGAALNLSRAGDLVEAAANLFRMLRELDGRQPTAIAVMPIPSEGLGLAINDRLRRAAAPA